MVNGIFRFVSWETVLRTCEDIGWRMHPLDKDKETGECQYNKLEENIDKSDGVFIVDDCRPIQR